MKSPVHDVVIDDVCCPAKIVAMSMPQISSSVVCRPPYTFWYLASMNCCSTSSSRLPDARRAVTTFWKMARISSRALHTRSHAAEKGSERWEEGSVCIDMVGWAWLGGDVWWAWLGGQGRLLLCAAPPSPLHTLNG
eukprot:351882-Chlamydomonas_euryale.AAC.16